MSPPDGTGSNVGRMLAIFDVERGDDGRFVGDSDGGERRVVDGSQLLGQAIVATSKTFPDYSVRSAHALFTRAVDDLRPLWFDVEEVHRGRSITSAIVSAGQGDRRCATITVLADVIQDDVVRHGAAMPDVGSPADAIHVEMPMLGRELRIVGVADPNDPDEVGPPVLDVWLHYEPVPTRPDLAKALLSHFTGHLSISATMRGHAGLGTSMAHETVSTAVMGITIDFHEPVEWEGWLLYHHESTYRRCRHVVCPRADLHRAGRAARVVRTRGDDPRVRPWGDGRVDVGGRAALMSVPTPSPSDVVSFSAFENAASSASSSPG